MKRLKTTLGICFALFGCSQYTDKVGNSTPLDTTHKTTVTIVPTKSEVPDTSNQYIYDFMKVVIADQKLNLNYGLTIEPESDSYIMQTDETFLKTLLIEKSKPKSDSVDWANMTISANQLPNCLTNRDIAEMLFQKKRLSNFTWDSSRLGFNSSNKENWYSFSRPLFSKDRTKVVMMIQNACPGLCGTGWTVLFTKQKNGWTSQSGSRWVH